LRRLRRRLRGGGLLLLLLRRLLRSRVSPEPHQTRLRLAVVHLMFHRRPDVSAHQLGSDILRRRRRQGIDAVRFKECHESAGTARSVGDHLRAPGAEARRHLPGSDLPASLDHRIAGTRCGPFRCDATKQMIPDRHDLLWAHGELCDSTQVDFVIVLIRHFAFHSVGILEFV